MDILPFYAPMFLTYDSVFPNGATEADLAAIYRPRPGLPFTHYRWGDRHRLMWTTFTPQQIDVDLSTREGADYLEEVLQAPHVGGVTQVRLDAAGSDEAYMLARTVQLLLPGIAQLYYVGLMGAHNDMDLLARTGVGRDINRHYFSADEVASALADESSLARRQLELVRLRATHPAFEGAFSVEASPEAVVEGRFTLRWENGESWVRAEVDVPARRVDLQHS